ncbi:phage portal protein [Arthrobacter agilis]|uniref:phage portal protein n=1 Tax=Arthrobacter agilis TaxID=37921 RepID=UPI0023672F72|nr:phage portal protein [Arthrobacter agilis]WDF32241.1 phage portal protein [Arthrobacter agilis]
MKEAQARSYLETGLKKLSERAPAWNRRQEYFEGKQDLPYAPPGVNAEYLELREMSLANVLGLCMKAPIQRMQADGFRTGRQGEADLRSWVEIWQPNKLDSRSPIVFQQMFNHGRGIMSVSPNTQNRKSPIIRPENAKRVWLEPNPEDPFEALFAVKTLEVAADAGPISTLWTPDSYSNTVTTKIAYVYTAMEWVRFEAKGISGNVWELADAGRHNMQGIPFVGFDFNVDADGNPRSAMDELIPQQNAVNTIRFQTLLAMQFSAYRQRVFTAYDPVVRDKRGEPIWQTNPDGTLVLDSNRQPLPIVTSPGRIGVDRALVFPGADTKVFDLPESNLDNYIKVLQQFLTDMLATGQIPPSYALTKMANLTGDGMAGAESTFQSLINDIQRAAGEGIEQVMRLANVARGETEEDLASEVIWADTEIRSFAQIIDAIGKLITSGMARTDAWAFLPSATPARVANWVSNSDGEAEARDEQLLRTTEKLSLDA